MVFLLLGNQEFFGDLNFLFLSVAGYRNHFHPVQQRPWDVVHRIGGDHPQHPRQIKRQLDIVVAKGVILLRIKYFQQRRARVAAKIRAHLVDFVQQKYWIF